MDAIKLLKQQHKEVDELFQRYEKARSPSAKGMIFNQIADALAIHCTIEEKHFYPAVMARQTKDILLESVEEHLAAKRVIADLLAMEPTDRNFDAKVTVLKEEIHHHVHEENTDLFPKAQKVLDKAQLEELGEVMQAHVDQFAGTTPRNHVPDETYAAAPV